MNKKNIPSTLFLALILFSINSFGKKKPVNISFIANWQIGDIYKFSVTKIKQKYFSDILQKTDTTSYIAKFIVVDSTEENYTLRWKYENSLLKSYKIPDSLANKFEKYNEISVLYTTNNVGEFLEITNWEEISSTMESFFKDINKYFKKYPTKENEKLKIGLDILKPVYLSKEGIEQVLLKELKAFHFAIGNIFETSKKPVSFKEEIPNLFGGNPLKANSKITFTNVDTTNGFCTFISTMTIDPKDTKTLMLLVLKKMKLKDAEINEALQNSKYDMKDNNIFEYNYKKCIPTNISINRTVSIKILSENVKNIDKIEIKLLE